MFKSITLLALLGSLSSFSTVNAVCPTLDTVENFDLDAYISAPWYVQQQAEISYQPIEQNYCTTAEYDLVDSFNFWGYTVNVNNYAEDMNGNSFGGPLCAFQDDNDPTSSKLNVAPCFLPRLAAGPYWIVDYDESMGYALISGGQPTIETPNGCQTGDGVNNSGLWIFTREQTRDDALVTMVRGIASSKGLDVTVLNDVDQANCGSSVIEVTPPVCEDSDVSFGRTFFGTTRDCDWVGTFGFSLIRCLSYADECPETCGTCP